MKYTIYSNGKSYKIPNQNIAFGNLIKAEWEKEIAIKLSDGDTLYLTKTLYDDSGWHTLLVSLESGLCCSAFYLDPANDCIAQCGDSGWMSSEWLLTDSDAILRIYKFGDYENTYDLDSAEVNDEKWCRKHGYLAAILKFIVDYDTNEEYWYIIDPNNPISGQNIYLPNMQDTLFISKWAKTEDGPGFYYTFESGAEGVGFFIPDGDIPNGYIESYEGWFGSTDFYAEGSRLLIFQCGDGLYEYFEYYKNDGIYWDDWDDQQATLDWMYEEFGIPIELSYDGTKWNLLQEGTRNDF